MATEGRLDVYWREEGGAFHVNMWDGGEELGEGYGKSLHQAIEDVTDDVFIRRRLSGLITRQE
ncbi:hypothetical protein [Candidatus Solirubrobacter pratensis]|uniref:hypothetical protein n=1 Tax=Candidatus Solirubrobacter pratensis TaxID=1298857 RepID=UPI00048018AD|nr:hypothetical protein [Candidatus Solirubrobacter pratensis]